MTAQDVSTQNRFDAIERAELVERTTVDDNTADSALNVVVTTKKHEITSIKVVVDGLAADPHSYSSLQKLIKDLQLNGLQGSKL